MITQERKEKYTVDLLEESQDHCLENDAHFCGCDLSYKREACVVEPSWGH